MNEVDKYINTLTPPKSIWTQSLVDYIRVKFPNANEDLKYNMPTYTIRDAFVTFAPQKQHFSFYTSNNASLDIIKKQIPTTNLDKGCARIKYKQGDACVVMKKAIDIVFRDFG